MITTYTQCKDWVPCEFEVGGIYTTKVWGGKENIKLEIEVTSKGVSDLVAIVNGVMEYTFELFMYEETEVIKMSAGFLGVAVNILPYNIK